MQPGSSIVAGSFSVNGTTIAVAADDTIKSVVAKITDSTAGVTASYEPESELLLLTQNATGSAQTIDLAALNLDPGTFSTGIDSELDRNIDEVAALGAVSSGNFFINGTEVSVDTSTDSLNDVVVRINAADTGARARLIGGQRLAVESVDKKADLIVDNGSSDFFTAVNIQPQTFAALIGGLSKRDTRLIAKSVDSVATQVQKVFNDKGGLGLAKSDVASLQKQLGGIVAKVEEDISRNNKPKFIFDFNFESPATAFELEDSAAGNFQRSLDKFYADFRTTLTGSRDDPDDGLLYGLIRVLDGRIGKLSDTLGSLGVKVDNFT